MSVAYLRRNLVGAAIVVLLASSSLHAANPQVFVTSSKGSGALGSWTEAGSNTGADAGDAICQARASAAGLANPLAYRAWLSTSAADAFCRVQGLSGSLATLCGGMSAADPAIGPWVRRDGEPFAERLALITGSAPVVYLPVLFDENGITLPDADFNVWTGTLPSGETGSSHCVDWDSDSSGDHGVSGVGWGAGGDWTNFVSLGCDIEVRLTCLEIGPGDPLNLGSDSGELAFVTSVSGNGNLSSWKDAGSASGLDAGDAICQSRAAVGGLPSPSSFVAWLSDDTTDAKDRLNDGPFVRVDGFLLAASKTELLSGSPRLESSLNVTELGDYHLETFSNQYVWTGTNSSGTESVYHCSGWTSDIGQGVAGDSQTVRFTWTQTGAPYCYTTRPIYCFSTSGLVFWDNYERGDVTRWSGSFP
jgi:hypothetical protein